jgi:hypothetical protein
MSNITDEYVNFLKWFREHHLELSKYERNFSVPFKEGGGVSVLNSYKISQEEFDMLIKIGNEYYSKDNK